MSTMRKTRRAARKVALRELGSTGLVLSLVLDEAIAGLGDALGALGREAPLELVLDAAASVDAARKLLVALRGKDPA